MPGGRPSRSNAPPWSNSAEPSKENRLHHRIAAFAQRVLGALAELDFDQRQKLLRLVVEEVGVTGWPTFGCASPSTRTPAMTRLTAHDPARRAAKTACPAMTVCVPLVAIEGQSYRRRVAEQTLTKRRAASSVWTSSCNCSPCPVWSGIG